MVEETLARIGIPPPADYVSAFEALARWSSPGPDYLARRQRAAAAYRLGDYGTAFDDAKWCLRQRPEDTEADILHGLAALGAAASELLPLPIVGAGAGGLRETPPRLLEKAAYSFARAQKKAPGDARVVLGARAVAELAKRLDARLTARLG